MASKSKAQAKREAERAAMLAAPAGGLGPLPKIKPGKAWPKSKAAADSLMDEARAFLAERRRKGEDSTHNLWVAAFLGIEIRPGSAKGIGAFYGAARKAEGIIFAPMDRKAHLGLPAPAKRQRKAKASA